MGLIEYSLYPAVSVYDAHTKCDANVTVVQHADTQQMVKVIAYQQVAGAWRDLLYSRRKVLLK